MLAFVTPSDPPCPSRASRARRPMTPAKGRDAVTSGSTAKARAYGDAADLVEAIAAHQDRDAFAALFKLFAPRIKSYLQGLGTPSAAAEELAQDTLLAVWRKAAYFDRARAGASTWIFTIARNLRIDAARRERSALAYTQAYHPEEEVPRPDAAAAGADRERMVLDALSTLPPEQVEVVRMSFFQDRPHSEIARLLNIPLGTVKSRVRLGLSRLRSRLEDLA